MLSTGGLPMGAGKITREQIIEGLGYEPVAPDAIAGMTGVNLLTWTKQNDKTTTINWAHESVTYYKDGDFGNVKVTGRDNSGTAFMSVFYPTTMKLSTTGEYTISTDFIKGRYVFSCEYRTNYGFPSSQLRVFDKSSGNYANTGPTMLSKNTVVSGLVKDEQWHNIEVALDFTNEWESATKPNMNDGTICYGFTPINMSPSQYFEIRKPKLKCGFVIEPIWTPSPYDILSSLDDLAARVKALEDKLVV